jgi:hypothetical protein
MCGSKKTSNEQDGSKASLQMMEIMYHPDTIITTVLVSLGVVAVCVLVYLILHRLGFCMSHPRPMAEEKAVFDDCLR